MGKERKKDGAALRAMRLKVTKIKAIKFQLFVDFYLNLWYSDTTKFKIWGFIMFCKNCGQEIAEGAAFCPNCGATVAPAAEQPQQATYQQPNAGQQPYTPPYGQPQQPYQQYPGYGAPQVSQEPASGGLRFLCWLIPLVGIILYFVKKDEKPVYAKQCGVAALVGIIMAVVFYIIYFVVIAAFLGSASSYYYY